MLIIIHRLGGVWGEETIIPNEIEKLLEIDKSRDIALMTFIYDTLGNPSSEGDTADYKWVCMANFADAKVDIETMCQPLEKDTNLPETLPGISTDVHTTEMINTFGQYPVKFIHYTCFLYCHTFTKNWLYKYSGSL